MSQSNQCLGSVLPLAMFFSIGLCSHSFNFATVTPFTNISGRTLSKQWGLFKVCRTQHNMDIQEPLFKQLQVTIYKLQITNYKLQMTDYKLQVTSYKLQITNYRLQVTNYKLQVTNYKLQITSYKLQVTSYKFRP